MILKLLLLTIIIVAISLAGIAIKMFFKKGGEFKKSCGSVDPYTGERVGCSCGEKAINQCKNEVQKLN